MTSCWTILTRLSFFAALAAAQRRSNPSAAWTFFQQVVGGTAQSYASLPGAAATLATCTVKDGKPQP